MGIIEAVGGFLKAVAAVFGYRQQRDAEQNTPDQRSNAEAEQIQKDRDEIRKDIREGDPAKLDKDFS